MRPQHLTLAELHSRGFIWADRHLAGQHNQKTHGHGGGVSYDRNIQGFVVAHLPDGTTDTFVVSGSGLDANTVRHPTDLPKPLYHGSNAEIEPGEQIEPGHPGNFVRRMTHVYLTEDPEGADAESPKGARGYGRHVYEVRPTGWYGHRRDARGQEWATSDPVIVIREVPRPQGQRHLPGQHNQKTHGHGGGSGGYVPGEWKEPDKDELIDHRVAMLEEELSPSIKTMMVARDGPDAIRKVATEMVETGGVTYTNGPHTVSFKGAKGLADEAGRKRFLSDVDAFQTRYPAEGRVSVIVDESSTFGFGVGGETLMGTATIRINDKLFDPYIGAKWHSGMPAQDMPRVDAKRYVLAHEWGHAMDNKPWPVRAPTDRFPKPGEIDDDTFKKMLRARRRGMSDYGKSMPQEGFAEAFAEWALTKGTTRNPAARAYAEQFKWGERWPSS